MEPRDQDSTSREGAESDRGLDQLAMWAREAEMNPQFRDPAGGAEYRGIRDLRNTVEVARGTLNGPEESWDQIDELARTLAMELKRKILQLFQEREEKRKQ